MEPIDELEYIKYRLNFNEITYEEAEKLAEEPLKKLNFKAEKIAKKFGKKHRNFTFSGMMR